MIGSGSNQLPPEGQDRVMESWKDLGKRSMLSGSRQYTVLGGLIVLPGVLDTIRKKVDQEFTVHNAMETFRRWMLDAPFHRPMT